MVTRNQLVALVSAGLFGLLLCDLPAMAALLPPVFMNCVVAIGSVQLDTALQPPRPAWRTEGTRFFYGYLVKNDPDTSKREYETYLVTAKHVVLGHKAVICTFG